MWLEGQRSCGSSRTMHQACYLKVHALKLWKHKLVRFLCVALGRFCTFELDQTVEKDNVRPGRGSTFSGLFLKLKIFQEIRKWEEGITAAALQGEKKVISITELIRHRKKLQLSLYLLSYIIFWTTRNLFLVPFLSERLIMNNGVF